MPFPTYRQPQPPQPGSPNSNNPAGYSPYQPSGGAQSPYFNMGYAAGKSGIIGGSSSNATSPNSAQGPPPANVNAMQPQTGPLPPTTNTTPPPAPEHPWMGGGPRPPGYGHPNTPPTPPAPPTPPTPPAYDPADLLHNPNVSPGPGYTWDGTQWIPPAANPNNPPRPEGPPNNPNGPPPGTTPGYTPPQLGRNGTSGFQKEKGFEPWMYKLTEQDMPAWLVQIAQQQGLKGQQAIDRLIFFMLRNPNSDAYKQLRAKYQGVRPPGTKPPQNPRNPRQMGGGTTNPPPAAPPPAAPPPGGDKMSPSRPTRNTAGRRN